MIVNRSGLRYKNQMGYTLIEIIVAVAITATIISVITTAIFQVFNTNNQASSDMTAVRQVQDAGYWVSHDTQMAQGLEITGTSGFPLTLTSYNWDGSQNSITYRIVGSEFERSGGSVITVAQFIDPDNTSCKFADGSIFILPSSYDAFTISDAIGGDSGEINIRAGGVVVTIGGAILDLQDGEKCEWETPNAGDTVIVTASEDDTKGSWTSTTGTATAVITTGVSATLNSGGMLIFEITAIVDKQSESRIYKIVPRPS